MASSDSASEPAKRARWIPSEVQRTTLETSYSSAGAFPDLERRQFLAGLLGIDTRQVQVWFQNRRQKDRKSQIETSRSPPRSPQEADQAGPAPEEEIFAPRSMAPPPPRTSPSPTAPSPFAFPTSRIAPLVEGSNQGAPSGVSAFDGMGWDSSIKSGSLQGDQHSIRRVAINQPFSQHLLTRLLTRHAIDKSVTRWKRQPGLAMTRRSLSMNALEVLTIDLPCS